MSNHSIKFCYEDEIQTKSLDKILLKPKTAVIF